MLYQQTRQHVRTLNQKRNRCSDVCSTALSMKTEAYVALFSQARGSSKSRSIQLQVHCPCLGLVDGSSSLCATLNTARRAIPELPSAFIQLKAWKTFHQKPRSADKTAASLINRREAKAVMSWL